MDIQRGDQVYYRGEVWDVLKIWQDTPVEQRAVLARPRPPWDMWLADPPLSELQRVEQVR